MISTFFPFSNSIIIGSYFLFLPNSTSVPSIVKSLYIIVCIIYFKAFVIIFFNLLTNILYFTVALKIKFLLKFNSSSIMQETICNICSSSNSAKFIFFFLTYVKNSSIVSCINDPVLKL